MATADLKSYTFSLTLGGVSQLTVEMADALFGAGCGDATPAGRDCVVSVDFDREAESLGDAVGSAIKNIERAGYTVARVEVEAPKG